MSAVLSVASFSQQAEAPAPPRTGFDIDVTEVESILRRTASVALGQYRCGVEHPRFAGGGPQRCPYIVFPRSSVRITRLNGQPLVYTPNTISFHDVGDIYHRSAISEEGERCDWIALAPNLLRDIGMQVDRAAVDRERLFIVPIAPSAPEVYLAQRALFRAVREDPDIGMLEIEEHVVGIVDVVLRQAFRSAAKPGARVRRDSARAPKIVNAAVAMIAERFQATLGVEEIGRHVHASPSYLARQFRRRTGFSMHAYQQQLRLRAALDTMPHVRRDLTGLAVHLGFSSHSHFTSVFHRQFGMTPSAFCETMTARRVRALRSTLAAL